MGKWGGQRGYMESWAGERWRGGTKRQIGILNIESGHEELLQKALVNIIDHRSAGRNENKRNLMDRNKGG